MQVAQLYSVCFSASSVGLADPKAVVSHFTAHDKKEVLSPLQVTEFNNMGNEPHYYSSTGNLQVSQPSFQLPGKWTGASQT